MTSMSHVTTAWMWELSATLIKKVICNKVLFVLNLYIIREVNLLPTERSVTIINFRGGQVRKPYEHTGNCYCWSYCGFL